MNSHVKSFSDKLNENIGRGSVIFIKGRPTSEGRKLYATTIDGWTEIRQGLKMVFLGNQIYRVIRKDGKFFGRKVGYSGEDGLKGVLNLKNPGRPSLVLNHNKTPFHWITLKYLDIGSAIREVGSRLITHEMILEEKDEHLVFNSTSEVHNSKFYRWAVSEMIDYVHGKDNSIVIESCSLTDVDDVVEYVWQNEDDLSDGSRGSIKMEAWEVNLKIAFLKDKIKDPDIISQIEKIQEDSKHYFLREDFLDMLGSYTKDDSIEMTFFFDTDIEYLAQSDPGDYYTPGTSEVDIEDIENTFRSVIIEIKDYLDKEVDSEDIENGADFERFSSEIEPIEMDAFMSLNFMEGQKLEDTRRKRQAQFKAFKGLSNLKSNMRKYTNFKGWISKDSAQDLYNQLVSCRDNISNLSNEFKRLMELQWSFKNDDEDSSNISITQVGGFNETLNKIKDNINKIDELTGLYYQPYYRSYTSHLDLIIQEATDPDALKRGYKHHYWRINSNQQNYFNKINKFINSLRQILRNYPYNAEILFLETSRKLSGDLNLKDSEYISDDQSNVAIIKSLLTDEYVKTNL